MTNWQRDQSSSAAASVEDEGDLRRAIVLYTEDPISSRGIVEAGKRLGHLAAGAKESVAPEDQVLEALEAIVGLATMLAIEIELVRVKSRVAVLRCRSVGELPAGDACTLIRGALSAIPEALWGIKGSVIESACSAQHAEWCLFTLTWDRGAQPRTPAISLGASEHDVDPSRAASGGRSAGQHHMTEGPQSGSSGAFRTSEAAPPDSSSSPMEAILIRAQEEGGPPHLRHNHADRADAPDMATDEELITKHPRLPIRLVPLWLRRRGWLLVVTVVAGACGGWFVGGRAHVTFSAVSTVVVPSGANGIGPGSANEAGALAVTYSAVIPTDEAILHSVSTDLGVSTSTVASRIRVSVETGTSVLDLRYTAPTASEALRGSVALARIVGGLNPVTAAIPVGSITIVQLATSVSHVGELTHFGLEIGSILGLAIGGILLFAAERADPRADSAQDAEAMSGVRSTQVPRDVSMAELARALVGTLPADAELTLVPIRSEDVAASWALKVGLDDEVEINRHMTRLAVSGPLETGTEYLLRGDGATVLVVGAGERERDIRAATERLQILERSPVWTVLVDRRTKWGDIVTV